mgnify:CR=1 FL=1
MAFLYIVFNEWEIYLYNLFIKDLKLKNAQFKFDDIYLTQIRFKENLVNNYSKLKICMVWVGISTILVTTYNIILYFTTVSFKLI